MIGDKLYIGEMHTARAAEICQLLAERIQERLVISVAGESGCGKSVTSTELARLLNEQGHQASILQQDDYFVFPPMTNHEMRRNNIEQVGMYEVKLDLLDSNLRSFKRNESPIYKPLVIYNENKIIHEEMDVSGIQVLIAEGTYTTTLNFVDVRVFIDLDYLQTLEFRKRRARDKAELEPFVQDVLEREHQIISQHKSLADLVIPPLFDHVEVVKR